MDHLRLTGRTLSRRQMLRLSGAAALSLAASSLLAACGGSSSSTATSAPTRAAAGTTPSAAGGSTPPPPSPSAASSPSSSAGSGSGSGGGPTPTTFATITPPTPTGSGTAQGGGRLTLIIESNVPDLDPHSAYDYHASAVFFGTHEMLVRLKGSDTLAYQPMLATEWSNNADFSEWTFKIPAGVKFHDGTDCDAPAVVKSFQRFFQLGLGPVNVITRFVDKPEDITAPDATTVTFKLKSGNEIFLAAMASQYGPLVVSPAAMDANKTADDPYAHEWFRSNPVGTGPYKLKEYVQNDHITLERFEDFHGGWDGAHFDEVVFRIVVENATRRQLMETNQADASTQNLTPKDVTELEQAGKLQVLRYDSTNANWIALNAADKIKDVNARLAFCYAFPYDDVRQGVWDSLVVRTSGAMTPTTHGYDPNGFIFDTDLDKAKQLLDQSGFDKSQKLEFWLDESSETDKEMAQLFQANLQTLGIQMNVVTKEGGALTDFLYGNATAEERPAFFSAGWWPDYNDGYNELYPNFYSNSNQTSAGPNRQYYKNDRVDQILDTVGAGVPDDQYTSLLAEANKIMVLDDPASIFYGSQQWFTVMQPNIKGFISNPIYIGTYNLYDMYREA